MSRISPHVTETNSVDLFRSAINKYSNLKYNINSGDMLFRDVTERDYGVDGYIEIFENGNPTGNMAYIQIKGTEDSIQALKNGDEVSCPGVTESNLCYCKQKNIPVFLVYVSLLDNRFYFVDLQSCYVKNLKKQNKSGRYTINIPVDNNQDNIYKMFEAIKTCYKNGGVNTGTKIIVSKDEPEGLGTGDFWLEID